jgi:hypothetical protein
MTALACLKILVGDDLRFADIDTMAELVAKVADAYLETKWTYPRRYGLVAPFSFVLADPRATLLDARELQTLARDLQVKLFGQRGDGEVSLLMLEGDKAEVMRFAGMPAHQLKALLAADELGEAIGRVCRITSDGVISLVPAGGPVAGEPPMEALQDIPSVPPRSRVGYRGVFHAPRELFVGNVAVWRADEPSDEASLAFEIDAPAGAHGREADHDIPILQSAREILERQDNGVMFFPISFSTLIKPSARDQLLPHLRSLPRAARPRLAAAIYDTPRAPSFSAMQAIKSYLSPFFARLDLRVSDPAFRFDDLPLEFASSVTLILPDGAENLRLSAAARFLRDAPGYTRKHIWQGISELRTRRELNACIEQRAPFLSGPAVTDLLEAPTAITPCSSLHLPLHDWSHADGPDAVVA